MHSPIVSSEALAISSAQRVPSAAEVQSLLERAVGEIPASKLWVNPDCGLKTRGYDETVASLEHIIEATRAVRAELSEPVLAE